MEQKTKIAPIVPIGCARPVSETLPEAVQRIVQALHPEKIILFGSYANGSPTPDSDVDLMVVVESDLPPTQRYLAVSRLLDPRPFPLDLLVKRPDEIHRDLQAGNFFIRDIMSQGRVLYERRKQQG